jgi:Yip1 domain
MGEHGAPRLSIAVGGREIPAAGCRDESADRGINIMDVFNRAKGIMLAPETEWPEIEKEPGTPAWLFPNYVVYLAAIPPIAGFIGASLIGITVPPMGTFRVPLFAGMLAAVIAYLLSFVIVYAVAIIVDQLAPRFGAQKDFSNALKVTVYCFTPYWVGGIFQLMAGTRFLAYVIGLFGVYLLSLGLPRLMKSPPDKTAGYVAAVAGCAIVIVAAITLIEVAFVA